MGGRNGGAAGAGGTGVFGTVDPCPADGMNATHTHGTVITAVEAARHWHAVWQQSSCPVGAIGAGTSCIPAAAIAPWQWTVACVTCACACGACMGSTSTLGGAPNASAVHPSNASASVRRKIGEFGRGKRNMREA